MDKDARESTGDGAGAAVVLPDPGIGVYARRAARRVFWLMVAINFLNYADRWVFSALANDLKAAFGFDDFRIGLLSSAFLVVYTLVALPTGYLADRVGRGRVVAVGVALWSAATAATAVAATFPLMLLVRAAAGVGEGSYYPAGTALLAAHTAPAERPGVLARWGVGALAGAGFGFLFAGALAGGPWRLAFVATGLPGLVLAALIARVPEKTAHEDDPAPAGGSSPSVADAGPGGLGGAVRGMAGAARRALAIPTVRTIVAMQALGFFALTAVSSFLVIVLGASYGRSALVDGAHVLPAPYPTAGLAPALVAAIPGVVLLIGGVAGVFGGGAIAERLARRRADAPIRVSAFGFLAAAPCLAAALAAPRLLALVPAYAAAGAPDQVRIGVAAFACFGLAAAAAINVYSGPLSAALQAVVAPADRSAAGGTALTLAHLLGDIHAPAVVGALAGVLAARAGGEQIGTALLLTCPLALVAAGLVGLRGAHHYAADADAAAGGGDATMHPRSAAPGH